MDTTNHKKDSSSKVHKANVLIIHLRTFQWHFDLSTRQMQQLFLTETSTLNGIKDHWKILLLPFAGIWSREKENMKHELVLQRKVLYTISAAAKVRVHAVSKHSVVIFDQNRLRTYWDLNIEFCARLARSSLYLIFYTFCKKKQNRLAHLRSSHSRFVHHKLLISWNYVESYY